MVWGPLHLTKHNDGARKLSTYQSRELSEQSITWPPSSLEPRSWRFHCPIVRASNNNILDTILKQWRINCAFIVHDDYIFVGTRNFIGLDISARCEWVSYISPNCKCRGGLTTAADVLIGAFAASKHLIGAPHLFLIVHLNESWVSKLHIHESGLRSRPFRLKIHW